MFFFGHTERLNGKEFNGRAIIADGRNSVSPILVRDLKVCKPTGSSTHSSSRGAGTAAISVAPETPLNSTAGHVAYPDSSMFSSPTSTASSGFSQVGLSSHTTSSSLSSSPVRSLRPREYQCFISLSAARELMPQRFAQGGAASDTYSMSMLSSGYMTSPDMSFSQGHIAGCYDSFSTGFSTSTPYGYGTIQQSFVPTYSASSERSQAMYNVSASYAVQPPTYSDYYPPSTVALTAEMSNLAIGSHSGGGGGGGVIYTEQRGVHIRDISRRASEDQIRKMIRDATGPEASLIEMIKIPAQDGAPRGHAFIHCRSASLAKRLVDHLDGYEFKGRKLQVRLMKEGDAISGSCVAPTSSSPVKPQRSSGSGSSSSSSGKHHRHRKEEGSRRTERKERDIRAPKSSSKTISSSDSSSRSSKTVPLVVGGNLATASISGTATEKHGKKSSVVIADGSSGRRLNDADSR